MFKTHFSFSSVIFTNDIKKFFYLSLTNDEKIMTNQKLIETTYKINMNKTLKVNEMINRMLKQFIAIVTKLNYFFFDKCIKKTFNQRTLKKFS